MVSSTPLWGRSRVRAIGMWRGSARTRFWTRSSLRAWDGPSRGRGLDWPRLATLGLPQEHAPRRRSSRLITRAWPLGLDTAHARPSLARGSSQASCQLRQERRRGALTIGRRRKDRLAGGAPRCATLGADRAKSGGGASGRRWRLRSLRSCRRPTGESDAMTRSGRTNADPGARPCVPRGR